MVTVVFGNSDFATAKGLWQWDYGQKLCIQGLRLPKAVELHFSLQETGGDAVTRIGVTRDQVTEATIPDSLLENNGTGKDYSIFVFIYLSDAERGETVKKIKLYVKARPRPEEMSGSGEEGLFREVIEEVNTAADRAQEAEHAAQGWARGAEDLPEREKDNARYYAERARDAAAGVPGQVEEGKRELERYVAEQEENLRGETGNVYFAAFKVEAGRLKMYSDPEIDRVRFVRVKSRLLYRLNF